MITTWDDTIYNMEQIINSAHANDPYPPASRNLVNDPEGVVFFCLMSFRLASRRLSAFPPFRLS